MTEFKLKLFITIFGAASLLSFKWLLNSTIYANKWRKPRKKWWKFFVCISYLMSLVTTQCIFFFPTHPIIFKISAPTKWLRCQLMVINGTGIHTHILPYFFIAHHNLWSKPFLVLTKHILPERSESQGSVIL